MTNKSTAVIYPSEPRTSTPTAVEFSVKHSLGAVVLINVTAVTATPTITVGVEGIDPVSGGTWTIITSAGITSTGLTPMRIRPGLGNAAGVSAGDLMPETIRVTSTHSDGDSITYSVSVVSINE